MTSCTASRYGEHDYSAPPHNTPDDPRDVDAEDPCHAGLGGCQDEGRYLVVIYQPGSHEWIRMRCCAACTAGMRERHARLGPGGTAGITRIGEIVTAEAP